jgi:hypothetical protein
MHAGVRDAHRRSSAPQLEPRADILPLNWVRRRVVREVGLCDAIHHILLEDMPHFAVVRVARVTFGFLAIWCLGCTSFDVLLDHLLASRDAHSCMTSPDSTRTPASVGSAVHAIADASTGAMGCGCSHCVAVQTAAEPIALPPHPLPHAIISEFRTPPSVDREPLVPPPVASRIG